jgi:hypothetical protein
MIDGLLLSASIECLTDDSSTEVRKKPLDLTYRVFSHPGLLRNLAYAILNIRLSNMNL